MRRLLGDKGERNLNLQVYLYIAGVTNDIYILKIYFN